MPNAASARSSSGAAPFAAPHNGSSDFNKVCREKERHFLGAGIYPIKIVPAGRPLCSVPRLIAVSRVQRKYAPLGAPAEQYAERASSCARREYAIRPFRGRFPAIAPVVVHPAGQIPAERNALDWSRLRSYGGCRSWKSSHTGSL